MGQKILYISIHCKSAILHRHMSNSSWRHQPCTIIAPLLYALNCHQAVIPSQTASALSCRMCGMDVDPDDSGSGEEEKDDELWIGDGVKMLPPPMAHSGSSAWGSRRGRCGCLAYGAVLILWNLCVVFASAALLAVVFAAVLSPALLLLYVGFLCHSRVSCLQSTGASSSAIFIECLFTVKPQ